MNSSDFVVVATRSQDLSQAIGLLDVALKRGLSSSALPKIKEFFSRLQEEFPCSPPSDWGTEKRGKWQDEKSQFEQACCSAKRRKKECVIKAINSCKTQEAERWVELCGALQDHRIADTETLQLEVAFKAAVWIKTINTRVAQWATEPVNPIEIWNLCSLIKKAIETVQDNKTYFDPLTRRAWEASDWVGKRVVKEVQGAWPLKRKVKDVEAWCTLLDKMRAKLPRSQSSSVSSQESCSRQIIQFRKHRDLIERLEKCKYWVADAKERGIDKVPNAQEMLPGFFARICSELNDEESKQFGQLQKQFSALVEELRLHACSQLRHVVESGGKIDSLASWATLLGAAGQKEWLGIVDLLRDLSRLNKRIDRGEKELTPKNGEWIAKGFNLLPEALKKPQSLKNLRVKEMKPLLAVGNERVRIIERIEKLLKMDRTTPSSVRQGLLWAEVAKWMKLPFAGDCRDKMIESAKKQANNYLARTIETEPHLLDILKGWAALLVELKDKSVQFVTDQIVRLNDLDAAIAKGLGGLDEQTKKRIGELYRSIPKNSRVDKRHSKIRERVLGFLTKTEIKVKERWEWVRVAEEMKVRVDPNLKRKIDFEEACRLLRFSNKDEKKIATLIFNIWKEEKYQNPLWRECLLSNDADERWTHVSFMESAGLKLEESLASHIAWQEMQRLLETKPMDAKSARRIARLLLVVRKGDEKKKLEQRGAQMIQAFTGSDNLVARLTQKKIDAEEAESWAYLVSLITGEEGLLKVIYPMFRVFHKEYQPKFEAKSSSSSSSSSD